MQPHAQLNDVKADPVNAQLEWLQAVIASMNDGIVVIDSNSVVQLVNPEYTRITGIARDEIVGKPLSEVRPGAQLVHVLKDGKSRSGVIRNEGGTEYVVDMAPIFVGPKIAGAVSVSKAMTQARKLVQELQYQKEKLNRLERTVDSLHNAKFRFENIVGKDRGLKEIVHIAMKAADSHLPVLITGESGTGKELFAEAIHNQSNRVHGPFVPVNCSAIPKDLLESELFGYEEGAFTSAKKGGKMGLFELANEGTIFLDEIGDFPYPLQAKLLRVLQENTIWRIGDVKERRVNVRVIAATNKDLLQLMRKSRFREDLFYRLNVINIKIPPLRERKGDILPLIYSIIGESVQRSGTPGYSISDEALYVLQSYDWPGNVRELKNAIEYAMCMADQREITIDNLPSSIPRSDLLVGSRGRTLRETVRMMERNVILKTIERYGNDIHGKKRAAAFLGISLATLYNKLQE